MTTNWEELAQTYKKTFYEYAPLGNHKAKVDKAEVTELSTGSIRVVFTFQTDDQYKYPKSTAHWVSRKNINWTKWHHACMLQVLGIDEAKAQQAIDSAEKDGASNTQIVKAYQALYDRACSRHPEVEIEVREQYNRDGEKVMSDKGYAYTESEFADSRVYSSNKPKTADTVEEAVEDMGGEDADIDLDELPF